MSADRAPRSGSALLVALALPAIVASAFIYWATGTLGSRFGHELGIALLAALAIPLTIYVVIDRLWTKGHIGGTFVRSFALFFIIFIPLAINIPSTLTSFQRERQKETLKRMRAIAEALDDYAKKHDRYPKIDSVAALDPALAREDAWSHPFVLHSRAESYVLISYGLGGQRDVSSPDDYKRGATTRFEEDFVIRDGDFVRYPEGIQVDQ